MDNFTPDISEKLVQYLDGELTGNEKEELEQQLKSYPALQEKLDTLLAAKESIRLYGLKQKVAAIHHIIMDESEKPVKQINPVKRILRFSIAIAASIVLVYGAYMAYIFMTLTPEKVFAANFQPYELVTSRDIGIEDSPALRLYREKKYSEVVGLPYDSNSTIEEEFVRAMSFTELRNSEKAIESFKHVIASNENKSMKIYYDESEYYLALNYIRNKEYKNGLKLLNKIKENPRHLYYDKVSAKLLRKVKMLEKR